MSVWLGHLKPGELRMDTKIIGVSVLGLAAIAIGGVYLSQGGDSDGQMDPVERAEWNASAYQAPDMPVEYNDEKPERDMSIDDGDRGRRDRDWFGDLASRSAEFDLDGDGELSDEERRKAREAWRARMVERYDTDGDGEVSREERRAAMRERFENSDRGQQLIREFDSNGDGVLDEYEQAAMDEYVEMERAERRAEMIEQYDLDGDGELSREERTIQRETMMAEVTNEFDEDGDGELNSEEQATAWSTMRERRELERFVDRYDSNNDGVVNSVDYSAFLSMYNSGDVRADVNMDGSLTNQDVSSFSDMMARSQNLP